MTKNIYLDYNATAPMRPEIREAVTKTMAAPYNASSVHSFGREARKLIERARNQVAALAKTPPAQVIFNSGATESNNTVLKYFSGERILVSAIEHPSVLEAVPEAESIPVTKNGIIDLNALEDLLKKSKTALISVMLVNNETGAIQPVKEAAALAKKHGALVHCDAVQATGRIPVDIADLGVDFISLSSHKIGGPQGVGALILGLCEITPSWLDGGGQEKKARAGTENIAGITGFGMAAEMAAAELPGYVDKYLPLRDKLEQGIAEISPEAIIVASNTERVANTSLFALPGAAAETMLMAFDLEGIALSNGSACSSGTVKASSVLQAMGMNEMESKSALRISTGWGTTESDIDSALKAWANIYSRMKDKIKKEAHA